MSKIEMLTPDNSAIALIDYQPAMYQGVQSHDRLVPFNNVQVLAKAAKLFSIPTVITTVAEKSFSGPFMPEVIELFPNHKVIDRTSMNSWLDPAFRKAVAATGRKKFVLAGLWTEACVTFPTLDMLKEGYEVYIPADACGDLSLEAHNRAMDRAVQAGAIPITSFQYVFELQQDWARTETYEGVMNILRAHSPYGIQVRFSKWALGEHHRKRAPKSRNGGPGHEDLPGISRCWRPRWSDLQPVECAVARSAFGRAGGVTRHSRRRADYSCRQTNVRRVAVTWRLPRGAVRVAHLRDAPGTTPR